MDGENNGTPYEQMNDLGVHLFWKHPFIVVTVDFSMIFQFVAEFVDGWNPPRNFLVVSQENQLFGLRRYLLPFLLKTVTRFWKCSSQNERFSWTFFCFFKLTSEVDS